MKRSFRSGQVLNASPLSLLALMTSLLLSVSLVDSASGQESVEALVNKLPAGANVLMLVNVEEIQQSTIAGTDDWAQSIKEHYRSGMGQVLRMSRTAAVAARTNQRWAEPVWRAALLVKQGDQSFPLIKQSFPGNVDRHLGFEFVEVDNDSYILSPEVGQIGIFAPNERQYFARWLQHLNDPSAWVNGSYLTHTIDQYQDNRAHVAIGADLRFSYSPLRILDEVRDSELLGEHKVDPKSFAKLASTIQGFTIATQFTESINSVVELTFDQDVSSLRLVARELAFDFLEDTGIHIPVMTNWQVSVNDKVIRISGPLTINDFRLMVSELDLIDDMPAWAITEDHDLSPSGLTREYFKTVNRLMEDLRHHRTASTHFGSSAAWMERYAKRIQRLPTQHVDDEVVSFADQAINILIESSTELRNMAEKTKTDAAAIRGSRSRTRGSRGDLGVLTLSGTRSRQFSRFRYSGGTDRNEQRHAAQSNAEEVWVEINTKLEGFAKASLKLQRELESKYDTKY